MKINDFKAEVFFEEYEFTAEYLLTSSDAEAMTIRELLSYNEDMMEDFLDTWLGYTEVSGAPNLKKEIAKIYKTIGTEDIIVHAGAEEPIFNFMRTMLGENDHAVVMFPAYQSLYDVAAATGCEVSKWQIKEGDGRWVADLDELEKLIKKNTKVLCINSPHNPTGFVFSNDEILRIKEIAEKNKLYIFSDEVYRGFEFDGIERPCFADIYEKALSLGVMSKTYGLAGLRIGWIASKNREIKDSLTKAKHYTTVCSSAPAEFLSYFALKHAKQIIDRNKSIATENLKIAEEFFAKYPTLFEYRKPMGGTIAYLKLNIDVPVHEFCINLVREKGVLLLSSEIFDMHENYVRLGFGRRNFRECLEKFEEYLREKGFIV